MDINNLNAAEQAALAKADAAGVNITIDGVNTVLPKTPLPAAAAAAAAAVVKPAADSSQPATVSQVAPKPDYVPDKFYDAKTGVVNYEAMAKSYGELERSRAAAPAAAAAQPATITPPAAPDVAAAQAAVTAASKAATDAAAAAAAAPADAALKAASDAAAKAANDASAAFKTAQDAKAQADQTTARVAAQTQATQDLSTNGVIADATYDQLAKVGFDRATVDNYVAGEKAKAQLVLNDMYTEAGGQADYTKMVEWARTVYSPEEANAFDASLRAGDRGQMKQAVQGLKARYGAEFGRGSTTTITPNSADTRSTNVGFRSRDEMITAMRDPRYTKGEPAFHAEVAQKIAAAERAKVDLGLNIHGR